LGLTEAVVLTAPFALAYCMASMAPSIIHPSAFMRIAFAKKFWEIYLQYCKAEED